MGGGLRPVALPLGSELSERLLLLLAPPSTSVRSYHINSLSPQPSSLSVYAGLPSFPRACARFCRPCAHLWRQRYLVLVSMAVLVLTRTPIYGGTKHGSTLTRALYSTILTPSPSLTFSHLPGFSLPPLASPRMSFGALVD